MSLLIRAANLYRVEKVWGIEEWFVDSDSYRVPGEESRYNGMLLERPE